MLGWVLLVLATATMFVIVAVAMGRITVTGPERTLYGLYVVFISLLFAAIGQVPGVGFDSTFGFVLFFAGASPVALLGGAIAIKQRHWVFAVGRFSCLMMLVFGALFSSPSTFASVNPFLLAVAPCIAGLAFLVWFVLEIYGVGVEPKPARRKA